MGYAMDKLKEKEEFTKRELEEWLSKPNCIDEYYNEYVSAIEDYIKGIPQEWVSNKSIFAQFEYLDIWYRTNYVYKSLVHNDISDGVLMAANGYYTMHIASMIAPTYPKNPPHIGFDTSACMLANCLIQRWYEEGKELTQIINAWLQTKSLRGGDPDCLTGWFILELANLAFNTGFDCQDYNYPEDMSWYEDVFDQWITEDLNIIDYLVSMMCDNHLAQADYGDGHSTSYEFDWTFEFLYTYEILTWLSLREYIRLQNPEEYSHPLMQYAMNRLPSGTGPMPRSGQFLQVVEKLKAELKPKC